VGVDADASSALIVACTPVTAVVGDTPVLTVKLAMGLMMEMVETNDGVATVDLTEEVEVGVGVKVGMKYGRTGEAIGEGVLAGGLVGCGLLGFRVGFCVGFGVDGAGDGVRVGTVPCRTSLCPGAAHSSGPAVNPTTSIPSSTISQITSLFILSLLLSGSLYLIPTFYHIRRRRPGGEVGE